jgi:FtsP/CotA-like multicopper oxidase with cupredoxin domain
MASRREFVTATAALGVLGATPLPAPTPSQAPAPSQAARAFAARMRAFDSALSEAELNEIAAGVETNWGFGKTINPHGTALKNSDEPVPSFAVAQP